jgi:uracil-DNA glycosylase family 4
LEILDIVDEANRQIERKHPLARCEECPLYELNENPVLGRGPEGKVKVAVVGEAPGFVEATTGRPFVGDSGKVLDEVLRNNDINRKDVFVTNVVACRPEKNATPTPAAIEACKPRMLAELIEHEPEYVVMAGAVAAKALGLSGAMKKLRVGPPRQIEIPFTDPSGVEWAFRTKGIPTWHPAFAMRSQDALPDIDLDVSKITKGTAPITYTEPKRVVADVEWMALAAIEDLCEMNGPFAVDIETGFDKDETDAHADQRPLLCIGVGYKPGHVVIFSEEMMRNNVVMAALAKVLRDKPLVMHNGKSDVAGLMTAMGPVNLRYDTMLEHYVLDERTGGHSLGELGIELLGTPDWKAWTKPYLAKGAEKNFADIPRHLLYQYNAIDCDVTLRLHTMFWPRIQEQGRTKLHDETLIKAANQLVYPEIDGIGFDMPYSLELTQRLQDEISEVEGRMEELLGQPINPRSPQQLVKLFNERGWHVPNGKKSTGGTGPTTGEKALTTARLLGKYDEEALAFLDLLMQARDLSKDNGTYCRGMQKRAVQQADGSYRIHTTFTLHVTTTGRLSSKDPNLQNIKDKDYLRRQFIAAPGNVFVSGDYSQVEGRVLAVVSGDPYLGDLFRNTERDIFDEINQSLYGVVDKSKRRLLKTFFYGYSYGRTAHGIANDPEFMMDVRDAQRQLDAFKALIPTVGEWQEETWQKVQDQGYLETTFGRRRHFPLITNRNKDEVRNTALAFIPQSEASDICLRAFTHMRPELEVNYGNEGRIRLTIHDAIVTEVVAHREAEMREDMRYYMENSGNAWARQQDSDIPFQVAFKSGTSWDQLEG